MQRFLQQATGDIPRNTATRTQTCKYAHDPTCVPRDSDAALHTSQEEGSAYNPCSRTRDTRYTHPAPRQTRTHTRRAGHASGHPALRGIYRCSWCRTNGEAEARCSERATTRSEPTTASCQPPPPSPPPLPPTDPLSPISDFWLVNGQFPSHLTTGFHWVNTIL